MEDLELTLALHAFAVMLIWVPFAIGGALFDKQSERRLAHGIRETRSYHTRWDDPVVHPRRTWRDWRAAHARPATA